MTSSPITSWQIDGETMETVTNFIFLDSKITVDGDCSHETIRCLLLGKKAIMKLYSILKSRDITLPTKFHLVKATVFLVVMYRWESWFIKKAKHQRTDASNCPTEKDSWESLGQQGDPTSQSSRKSVLNIHWRDWCWSSNSLATWWEEQTHWIKPWYCESLWAGGEWDNRGWDGWMASPIQWTWVWANSRR